MRVNRLAILCFLIVYIIWGSTYLAIRYAIETLPALGMSSARFFLAAGIMGALALWKNEAPLSPAERRTSIMSGLLLILANGVVCVVEYWVPSGIVAVMIGAMPIWMMMVGWLQFGQARPTLIRMIGAIIGLSGVALIASSDAVPAVTGYGRFGVVMLFGSSIMWAFGTLIQRRTTGIKSVFRYSALQMGSGAAVTAVFSLAVEKPWAIDWQGIHTASLWAFFYLVIFGSVIAFTAYAWLSRNVAPHLVSTYALVNPVIAVILGSVFFQEAVTPIFLGASVLVLVGLSMLVLDWEKIIRRSKHLLLDARSRGQS